MKTKNIIKNTFFEWININKQIFIDTVRFLTSNTILKNFLQVELSSFLAFAY